MQKQSLLKTTLFANKKNAITKVLKKKPDNFKNHQAIFYLKIL